MFDVFLPSLEAWRSFDTQCCDTSRCPPHLKGHDWPEKWIQVKARVAILWIDNIIMFISKPNSVICYFIQGFMMALFDGSCNYFW